jgi:CDP-glucose 4,6-dehydratase
VFSWRDVPVALTGHTGFKGAWLCEWLLRAGAKVSGLALPPEGEHNLFSSLRLGERMTSTYGDVRDRAVVNAWLAQSAPAVVFHLAAQALVLRSVDDPVGTYATNVMGTVHVLDAIRRTPSVRAAVIVTSDKCYENGGWDWPYRESDPMGGKDPYSSSKGAAELAVSAFRRTYLGDRVAVATARAGNVIGGGDWSQDRIVPDIVRALVAGREPVLRFPGAVRPWQHVLDALSGYVLLAERLGSDPAAATGWNFGPAETSVRTVAELTERFLAAWGERPALAYDAHGAEHDAPALRLDSSRARLRLGWRPRLEFEEAIDWSARWYHDWHAGRDVAAITHEQLARYAAAAAAPVAARPS